MLRNLLFISLIWAVIILILSGLPGSSLPSTGLSKIPHFDKLVHMGLYFPLSFFLMAEFSLSKKTVIRRYALIFTLLIITLYGGSIELAQDYVFVQRSADWIDLASDLFGALLGISFYHVVGKRFLKR
ncbi:MAG: VanZ family protein [Bacteroidota bacterium]|nr:VanZ family protein [Bacteroidota bacterium]